MKAMKYLLLLVIVLVVLPLLLSGCKYDTKQPLWYEPYKTPATPTIQQIVPERAVPGINKISILGENFAGTPDRNKVYFDNVAVDVESATSTSITVRRPNLVSASAVVKLSSSDALTVAKFSPYIIDPVVSSYGSFLENLAMAAMTVDPQENLYVVMTASRSVIKATPAGDRIVLGILSKNPSDMTWSPNGTVVFMVNNAAVLQMDPVTGTESTFATLKKKTTCGDFDSNGCLYAGGKSTDLIIVKPDLSSASLGTYAAVEILVVRVCKDYVYLVVKNTKPTADVPALAIFRHKILDAGGTLGARELILDWANAGDYAASTLNDIAFSAAGTMYIGTNSAQPIMILNPDLSQDILYKDILPTTAERFVWGNGTFLYAITGGAKWDVIRIDMGEPGA
jgi:hypothetical protein